MAVPTNKKSSMSVGVGDESIPAMTGGGPRAMRTGKVGMKVGVGDNSVPAYSGKGLVPSTGAKRGALLSPQDMDV